MIRYSHVSLIILCDTVAEADAVTAHLGVKPVGVRESKSQSWSKKEGHAEKISWSWMLDSPKSHNDADVPERLWSLAEAIEPFADKLRTLNSKHKPWVDVLYHNTPQHPHGITGEFHWFRMPVEIMRRFSSWDLEISYEVFWFNHPDWVTPQRRSWLSRLFPPVAKGPSSVASPKPAG